MKANFKSQVIPKHLSVNGIDQIVKHEFIDYEEVFVQVYSISQNFKNHCSAMISDGFCKYKCQFRNQAKQLALNYHLIDYSIIKVTVQNCELLESQQFIIIYDLQVLDVDIRKLIGRPITYEQYKRNGYSNSYGSNQIKLDQQTSIIQQIKKNPKGKLLLKGKVTHLPHSTSLGMMIFKIQDEVGDQIQGVSFERPVIQELQRTIILGRTYIFSNFLVQINKKKQYELKFKQTDCVRSASTIEQYSMDQVSKAVKFQKKVQNSYLQQQKPQKMIRHKIPFEQNIDIERQKYKKQHQGQKINKRQQYLEKQRQRVKKQKESKQKEYKQKVFRQKQQNNKKQQQIKIQDQKCKTQQNQNANIKKIQQWKNENLQIGQRIEQKINNKFFKSIIKTINACNRYFTITGRVTYQKQHNSYRKINIQDQNSEIIDIILWFEIKTTLKMNGVYRFSNIRVKAQPQGQFYELQSSKNTKIVQVDESEFKQIKKQVKKQELQKLQKRKQDSAPTQQTKKLPPNPTILCIGQLLQLSQSEILPKIYPLVNCLLKIRLNSLSYKQQGDQKNFFTFYCGECRMKVGITLAEQIKCLECRKQDIMVRWNLRVQVLDANHAIKCAINDQALERLLNIKAKDALNVYTKSKSQFQAIMHKVNFQQRVCKFHIKKSESNVFFNILQIYAKDTTYQLQFAMKRLGQVVEQIKIL